MIFHFVSPISHGRVYFVSDQNRHESSFARLFAHVTNHTTLYERSEANFFVI
jgi:hypothetical protein